VAAAAVSAAVAAAAAAGKCHVVLACFLGALLNQSINHAFLEWSK